MTLILALMLLAPVRLLTSDTRFYGFSTFAYFNPADSTGGTMDDSHPGVTVGTPALAQANQSGFATSSPVGGGVSASAFVQ